MADIERAEVPDTVYRAVRAVAAEEDDFYSFAKLRGPPQRPLRGERLISWYGVSVFASVDALTRRKVADHVAEIQPSLDSGVLMLKTARDPDHYDLVGDRGDMLRCVIRVFSP